MIRITKTDLEKEKNGVWTKYEGVEVLIARMHSARFLRIMRKKAEATVEGTLANLDEKKTDEIMIEAMAEEVLLGWKPFEYDGQQIEYNRDNAISLLTSDIDFRDFVTDFSRNPGNYRNTLKGDAGK